MDFVRWLDHLHFHRLVPRNALYYRRALVMRKLLLGTCAAVAGLSAIALSNAQGLINEIWNPYIHGGYWGGGTAIQTILDQATVLPTGASARRSLSDKLSDFLTIADFLATGQTTAQLTSGAIDAQPAISAMLVAGVAAILPCGTYRLDEPIATISTSTSVILRGAGRGCVTFNVTFAAGNVIQAGVAGATGLGVQGMSVGGFKMVAIVTRTSGAGIAVGTHYDADFSDFSFDGPWSDEVIVQGNGGASARTHIHDFRLGSVSGTTTGACIRIISYANDTRINQGGANRCNQGLVLTSGSGTSLTDFDIFGSVASGVSVNPSSANGDNVNAFYVNGAVYSDTSGGNDWEFIGTGPTTDIHLTNVWGGAAGSLITGGVATIVSALAGLVVTNTNLDGLTISSGHFHDNGGNGILIGAGKNISIDAGTQVWNNDSIANVGPGYTTCTTPGYDGIVVTGTADWVKIIGASSGKGGYFGEALGWTNCQRYGIYVGSGTGDTRHITLIGTQNPNNQTGNFQMPTGTYIVNTGNL
jgi:hypothetical protein